MLVPDLAGWRRERVPTLPDVAAMTIAPDWVCEIGSPSTARWDRAAKMPVYVRTGVAHLWIVDPIARTLEVFVARDSRWIVLAVHGDVERVRAMPFDAVELDLAPWWDRHNRVAWFVGDLLDAGVGAERYGFYEHCGTNPADGTCASLSVDVDPLLTDGVHIAATSPLVGLVQHAYGCSLDPFGEMGGTSSSDFDEDARTAPSAIGADEP